MSDLYKSFAALKLTENQLREHGYPRPRPFNTCMATVYKPQAIGPNICARCRRAFESDHYDKVRVRECNYHQRKMVCRRGKNQLSIQSLQYKLSEA